MAKKTEEAQETQTRQLDTILQALEETKRRCERAEERARNAETLVRELQLKVEAALKSIYQIKRFMSHGQPRGQTEAILRALTREIQALKQENSTQ